MPNGTDEPERRQFQVGQHIRTAPTRPITFVCQECGAETTEEQRPGPTRRYCTPCNGLVQRKRNAERQRRVRERRRRWREIRPLLEVITAIEDERRA